MEVGVQGEERVYDMKMLTIVAKEQFDDYVLLVFHEQGIKGYTVISGVSGSGETGAVSGKHEWIDRNTLFMVALDDAQMATLVTAMKELHGRPFAEDSGGAVSLKMFLQPCEVVL